ncbi:hypothetical protein FHR32_008218 [Streptosporangium album]|uniref:Uncharacterized protein n=1 Tax=Streptosporangium album TaxID=47479 RepID=A0A7W7S505_9ACTN|nr:twin-arginine translocation signal domain-containing protein [Streptosporangium album]MBB4943817.1 hypothetical protein [Streptosporangium album]
MRDPRITRRGLLAGGAAAAAGALAACAPEQTPSTDRAASGTAQVALSAPADTENEWTPPIGSAVFAIPPGCSPDGWIGETLLS